MHPQRPYKGDWGPTYGRAQPYGDWDPAHEFAQPYGDWSPAHGIAQPYGDWGLGHGSPQPYGDWDSAHEIAQPYGDWGPTHEIDQPYGDRGPGHEIAQLYGYWGPTHGSAQPYGDRSPAHEIAQPYGDRGPTHEIDQPYGDRGPGHEIDQLYGYWGPTHGSAQPYGDRSPAHEIAQPYGDRGSAHEIAQPYGDWGPAHEIAQPYGDRSPAYGSAQPYGDRGSAHEIAQPYGDRGPAHEIAQPYGGWSPAHEIAQPYGDRGPAHEFAQPYGDWDPANEFAQPYGDWDPANEIAQPYGDWDPANEFAQPYGDWDPANEIAQPYGDRSPAHEIAQPYGDWVPANEIAQPYGDRSPAHEIAHPYGDWVPTNEGAPSPSEEWGGLDHRNNEREDCTRRDLPAKFDYEDSNNSEDVYQWRSNGRPISSSVQQISIDTTAPCTASKPAIVLSPLPNSDAICKKLVQLKATLRESPLPKEFDEVVNELSCSLCGVTSPLPKYMMYHWGSVRHDDEVRNWLEEWYKNIKLVTSERPKSYEFMEDELFCFLCMKPFSCKDVAKIHYDSKAHEKKLIAVLHELAISKYHNIKVFRCDLCNVSVTTEDQLQVHLDSPKHLKTMRVLGVAVHIPASTDNDVELKFSCDVCQIKTNSEEVLKIHMTSKKHAKKLKKISEAGVLVGGIPEKEKVFFFRCDICNIEAETGDQLQQHLTSPKHKLTVAKLNGTSKREMTEERKKSNGFWCETCNITANSREQYKMHLDSAKHAKRAAAGILAQTSGVKRQHEDNVGSGGDAAEAACGATEVAAEKKRHEPAVDEFLRRYEKFSNIFLNEPHLSNRFDEVYWTGGPCGAMLLLMSYNEYIWQTLARNSRIWSKDVACYSILVRRGGREVWEVTVTWGGEEVKGVAEGEEMSTVQLAAAEKVLNILQSSYYSLYKPKDTFKRMAEYENVDWYEGEEEEYEVEVGGGGGGGGGEGEEEEEDEEVDPTVMSVIDKNDVSHIEFDEMIDFYIQDYQANMENLSDLVFINFDSYERLAIKKMCAEYGIDAEYRRSKRRGTVVLVSKINTMYLNAPWQFLKVMLRYKNSMSFNNENTFSGWQLVEPQKKPLAEYSGVTYVD